VSGLCARAAGAGRQYAPAAFGRRFCAALNFTVSRLVKKCFRRGCFRLSVSQVVDSSFACFKV
jgi:hypothetical protein